LAKSAAIKIDEMPRGTAEQKVVEVEIDMVQTGRVKLRDGLRQSGPINRVPTLEQHA